MCFKCSVEKCKGTVETQRVGDNELSSTCVESEMTITRMMGSLDRLIIHQANGGQVWGRIGIIVCSRQNQMCKQRLRFIVFKYTICIFTVRICF